MSRKIRPRRRPRSVARCPDSTAAAVQPPEPTFFSRRTPQRVTTQGTDWMPLPAIIAVLFVGLTGYFVAEASLASYPHPLHWLATVVIGLFGYIGGLIWHRARGF